MVPRPISKELIFITDADIDSTQNAITLFTATFPCTLVGLRWSLSYRVDSDNDQTAVWAIVKVGDGNAPDTLDLTSGSTLYRPEEDCMAFGVVRMPVFTANDFGLNQQDGSTKSMRKLQTGDTLQFLSVGNAATANGAMSGAVQFFLKG